MSKLFFETSNGRSRDRLDAPQRDARRGHRPGRHPEVTAEMMGHGLTRVAGKVVPRGKRRLTIYLDAAVVNSLRREPVRAATRR